MSQGVARRRGRITRAAARVSSFAVALVCALALQASVSRPASAAPLASCTATTGTVVAVDFGHWGGPVVRGCGVGEPTGLDLLSAAGFQYTGDQHDGNAFVCRIGNTAFDQGTQHPTKQDDPCVYTPPGNAYWSYWLANSGSNSWSFSPNGAVSEGTAPGQVQAWEFGAGNPPAFSPASVRPAAGGTPKTSAAHTTAAGTGSTGSRPAGAAPGSTATAGTTGVRQHGSSAPAASATSTKSGSAGRTTAAAGSSAAGSSTTGSSTAGNPTTGASPSIVAASAARGHSSGSGSAVGIVLGLVLVLALAGGGWWLRQRRAVD